MAVAGLALALGPGHNIPMLGGSTGVAKEMTMLVAVIVVTSARLVLGLGEAPWSAQRPRGHGRADGPLKSEPSGAKV